MDKFINKTNKTYKIVLLISILLKIVFYILNNRYGLYVLIYNINQYIINLSINILIVIITLLILNNNAKKVRKYSQSVIALILIFILITDYLFSDSDKHYFYFQSPDNAKTLVVEENTFLLGGWSDFYEKRGIFIDQLGAGITTDDGGRPFTFNNYKLKWLDNNIVELYYYFGSGYGRGDGQKLTHTYKTTTIRLK